MNNQVDMRGPGTIQLTCSGQPIKNLEYINQSVQLTAVETRLERRVTATWLMLLAIACGQKSGDHDRKIDPDGCVPISDSESLPGAPPEGSDPYFQKYLDANGIAIMGSAKVCDRAVQASCSLKQVIVMAQLICCLLREN